MAKKLVTEQDMQKYCKHANAYISEIKKTIKSRSTDFGDTTKINSLIESINNSIIELSKEINKKSPDRVYRDRKRLEHMKIEKLAITNARQLYRDLKKTKRYYGYKIADVMESMARATDPKAYIRTELGYEFIKAHIDFSNCLKESYNISFNHADEDYEDYIRKLAYDKYLLTGGTGSYAATISKIIVR